MTCDRCHGTGFTSGPGTLLEKLCGCDEPEPAGNPAGDDMSDTDRNCWTCGNDEIGKNGWHQCEQVGADADAMSWWTSTEPITADAMPPTATTPCPAWVPKESER